MGAGLEKRSKHCGVIARVRSQRDAGGEEDQKEIENDRKGTRRGEGREAGRGLIVEVSITGTTNPFAAIKPCGDSATVSFCAGPLPAEHAPPDKRCSFDMRAAPSTTTSVLP